MEPEGRKLQARIAGINHQGWVLELTDDGKDLYPEIRRRARRLVAQGRRKKGETGGNLVRLQIMLSFGYYHTESSEHAAEYLPHFIRKSHPELIDEYRIPLDEYPRRCIRQIDGWKTRARELVHNRKLTHERSHEYGSRIMDAIETGVPCQVGGNVLNTGLIPNLPSRAVVEVPCLVDRSGVQGCYVGDLPEVCAAVNRTNINVQLLTIEAALTGRKEPIYHAAMLDPHTAAELTLDEIRRLCDDMIEAHGDMMPAFK
jgi:alpha-galactosidase